MVRDGWSWTDVGRPLAVAGIRYRSGAPISAAILRKKASEARADSRKRTVVDARSRSAVETVVEPPRSGLQDPAFWAGVRQRNAAQAAQAAVASSGRDEEEEPEVKPAALRDWSGTHRPGSAEHPRRPESEPEPAPSPPNDPYAAITKLLGKNLLTGVASAPVAETAVEKMGQAPLAETAEDRETRIARLLSQYGPEGHRNRGSRRWP